MADICFDASVLEGGGFDRRAVTSVERFINAHRQLDDRSYWGLRIFVNANLFLWHVDAFLGDADPVLDFCRVFDGASELLNAARHSGVCAHSCPLSNPLPEATDHAVGPVFGDTYALLTDKEYFDVSHQTLVERLTKNNIDPLDLFADATVVDAGCGSGKYSLAMARLGAAKVFGYDISNGAIDVARQQAKKVPYGDRMEYALGSVERLPAPSGKADIAWCNSVLHLTDDPDRAVGELARVVRPRGHVFVYVNGRFGLFELLVRALFSASHDIPRDLFQHLLSATGLRHGRIAWLVSTIYAPYRFIPKAHVESLFAKHGLTVSHFLRRGLPSDSSEQVASGLPYGDVKYGEGKLTYLLIKS